MYVADDVTPALTLFFRNSYQTGTLLLDWKFACLQDERTIQYRQIPPHLTNMHSLQGDEAHHRQSHHVTHLEDQHSLSGAAWLPMGTVVWDAISGVRGWNNKRAGEGKPGGQNFH